MKLHIYGHKWFLSPSLVSYCGRRVLDKDRTIKFGYQDDEYIAKDAMTTGEYCKTCERKFIADGKTV